MDFYYKICVVHGKKTCDEVYDYFRKMNKSLNDKKMIGLNFYNVNKKIGSDVIKETVWVIDQDFYTLSKNDVLVGQYCKGSSIVLNLADDSLSETLNNNFLEINGEKIFFENLDINGIKADVSSEKAAKIGFERLLDECVNLIYKKDKEK